MLCIDINECKDISEQNSLCKNGRCVNTEGSYKCVCLRDSWRHHSRISAFLKRLKLTVWRRSSETGRGGVQSSFTQSPTGNPQGLAVNNKEKT
ncbi:latent-transforming growth factor beta-binding protein 2 [Acipenser oxyrinchus oxyrinchus]|uniref:Latent-transforming growth factor beta-binding protein 2 n=1 Tax=Acipenser oxyrinchus oxyrinchus TaxID=40147 RepID=A0AAD8FRG5_ACIOX|nr:latent-transforming growth factor beta-binding protein 2 [Acipenser oxyrinchus oxyrinchus]